MNLHIPNNIKIEKITNLQENKMKLNIEFINMLYDIKWFSNCGKQVPIELGKV